MPKDDERKEMTQEELDAREEKFRTFFTTSVAQIPEEMTRRDDENEEKPKSLLGRLFRREKAEQQEGGTPEESRTGEIQLGGEEPEVPSDLELVLALEEEVAGPKPEQPKPAEPVSVKEKGPENPEPFHYNYSCAMHSTSTRPPSGSLATWTQDLAGKSPPK